MSATKKAKYTGPSGTGVVVHWTDPDTDEPREVLVEHNHELPADVPAKVRDGLLEQTDNWSEVKRDTGNSTKDKE